MPTSWRNPYNHYKPWSTCTTCGQDWPSQKITYNPRFGWQCPPCWDGLIQRDQFLQPIFPYEGTRKVASPVTNTLLEGIAPGSLFQTYTYNLRDRVTGQIWAVKFVPLEIQPNGALVFVGGGMPTLTLVSGTPDDPVFDGLRWINGWDIYVRNGSLDTEIAIPSAMNRLQGVCDFGEAEALPVDYLLYDRSFPDNIYQVVFHENDDPVSPGQVEVLPASGPAVGGILLLEPPAFSAPGPWVFYINNDQANFDDAPWPDLILWDNRHSFYVDTTTYGFPQLIYIP